MPLFAMIGRDGPEGSTRRREHRQAHVDHVTELHERGQVVFAGPLKSADRTRSVGAIIILTAPDAAQAEAIVQRDPYVSGGVFEQVTVEPFQQVLPQPS